jgi:hypothetical protein
MIVEYHDLEGLFSAIRKINTRYYKRVNANIIYLEELTKTNQIVYITQLRDAYSHLVEIFAFDDVSLPKNKAIIQSQLDRYSGHLERLLHDTYLKIVNEKYKILLGILPPNDVGAVRTQIAERISTLRVVDPASTNEKKIAGYISLIEFIEDVFNKFYYRN